EVEEEDAVVRVVIDDQGAYQGRGQREHERRDGPGEHRAPLESTHQKPTSPNGLGRPSLPGLSTPFGSSACFTLASTSKAGPSASGTNRERFSPTPWWWLSEPPLASTAPWPASHTAR